MWSSNKDGSGANTRFVTETLSIINLTLCCKTIVFRCFSFVIRDMVTYRIESPLAPQQSALEIRILVE